MPDSEILNVECILFNLHVHGYIQSLRDPIRYDQRGYNV